MVTVLAEKERQCTKKKRGEGKSKDSLLWTIRDVKDSLEQGRQLVSILAGVAERVKDLGIAMSALTPDMTTVTFYFIVIAVSNNFVRRSEMMHRRLCKECADCFARQLLMQWSL